MVMADSFFKMETLMMVIIWIISSKDKGRIVGVVVRATQDSLSQVKEMGMEFGNPVDKIMIYIRVNI